MTALQRRFKQVIDRLGDTLTVGGTDRRAIIALLSRGFAYSLISVAEVDAGARPLRLAYVPFDDTASVGQTAVWDGVSLTVKKVVQARFSGQTILKMLVLA